MFNESQKNKYLDDTFSIDERKAVIKSIFNNLRDIEQEKNKDFCFFDQEEMKYAISQVGGHKISTKKRCLSNLKNYLNWCQLNSIIEINYLNDVKYTDIIPASDAKFTTVPNIEYLSGVLEIGLPEKDKAISMNTIYKLYALLLYSGMTENEITTITKEEINPNDFSTIVYNKKNISTHPLLKKYLDKVFFSSVNVKNDNRLTDCIKGVRGIENIVNNFKNTIVRMNKTYQTETGNIAKLTASTIYESGVFYRLLQRELDTGEVDISFLKASFDIYEDKHTTKNIYIARLRNLLNDYEAWKRAWNYEMAILQMNDLKRF